MKELFFQKIMFLQWCQGDIMTLDLSAGHRKRNETISQGNPHLLQGPVAIELHIIVSYGMNINAIAKSIVHKVKYVVKETTGIEVRKVTVKVDGIKE